MRKILCMLVLCLFLIPTFAQESTEAAPSAMGTLLAFVNGDLLRLENNSLVYFDACSPDEALFGSFVPSNDGQRILLQTRPKIISQALEAFGTLGDIPYGQNFWLCDTSTGSLSRILAQPNADAAFAGELPSAEATQSRPTWSPDGTKLAWINLRFADYQQSLVIYDLATGTQSETVLALPTPPFPAPPEAIWTDAGIMLYIVGMDEVSFANVETISFFDPSSVSLSTPIEVFNGSTNSDFIVERAVVEQEDSLAYALRYYGAGWSLLNLQTGEQSLMNARLERFAPNNPNSLRLAYDLNAQFTYDWEIISATGTLPLMSYPSQRVAFAPDGSQVAYADSTLHLYNADSTIIDVANSDGFADDAYASIIWGASAVRLVPR